MFAEGHTQADLYPIALLWSEARLARRRRNRELASQAAYWYSAGTAIMGGAKKFQKQIEDLQNAD